MGMIPYFMISDIAVMLEEEKTCVSRKSPMVEISRDKDLL